MNHNIKPIIAISMGDPNGIGPEILFKALARRDIQAMATYVIFAPYKLWTFYKNEFEFKMVGNTIDSLKDIKLNTINVYNFNENNFNVQLGESTIKGGVISFESLQLAAIAVKNRKCDLLITAPINKANIQSDNFKFPGHTEYLESLWGGNNLMFMVHENLKVGLVTQHIPLKEVSTHISQESISHKLKLINDSLTIDFGISKPKIAVLGINPHAGDNGLIGQEEKDLIIPTLRKAINQGYKVFGPYPADSFFNSNSLSKFDGVLAMYHDQGLTPFKTLAGMEGVNFTAGLPFVRTSPDHGVGYDIAKHKIADETSMVEAIYTATNIYNQRKMNLDLLENALQEPAKQRRR